MVSPPSIEVGGDIGFWFVKTKEILFIKKRRRGRQNGVIMNELMDGSKEPY